MRIISNYTDVYDYIQNYGKDNSLTFKRICPLKINESLFSEIIYGFNIPELKKDISENNLTKLHKFFSNRSEVNKLFPKNFLDFSDFGYKNNFQFRVFEVNMIIGEKIYTTYNFLFKKTMYKNITPEKYFEIIKENINEIKHYKMSGFNFINSKTTFEDFKNYFDKNDSYIFYHEKHKEELSSDFLLDIHKEINSPIFFYMDRGIRDKAILKDLPIFSLGFENLNTEELYQEISYCLGNIVLNKNEPPEEISNEMKIEQHGFDLKQSFRHRK